MGKSYRKPYATVTGARSAAHDKMVARRCYRRIQEHVIRTFDGDWEDFVIPVRYEASFNNVCSWGRDGKQRLRFLDHNDFNPFWATSYFEGSFEDLMRRYEKRLAWSKQWIADLKRK
jgi:hypothetical protein